MAKKTNRPKAKSAKKQTTKAEVIPEQVEAAPAPSPESDARPGKTSKVTRSQAAAERIEDEYAYITDDLRRVFLLAAAMFALLIALNVIFSLMG